MRLQSVGMCAVVALLFATMGGMIYVSMNPVEIPPGNPNIYYTINEFTISDDLVIDGSVVEKTDDKLIYFDPSVHNLTVEWNEGKFKWITLRITIVTENDHVLSVGTRAPEFDIYYDTKYSIPNLGPCWGSIGIFQSYDSGQYKIIKNEPFEITAHYLVPIPYDDSDWKDVVPMKDVTFEKIVYGGDIWVDMNNRQINMPKEIA